MGSIDGNHLERLRAQEAELKQLMASARSLGDEQRFQEALEMLGKVCRLIDDAERRANG